MRTIATGLTQQRNKMDTIKFQFIPFEIFENTLKVKIEEDGAVEDSEIIHLINYVIVNLIIEGKSDKQVYTQLKFLGRKAKFERVESLRYCLKYGQKVLI